MIKVLTTHNVTWSRRDSYCKDQYATVQPEEFPSVPVKVQIEQRSSAIPDDGFRKFNFDGEEGSADE